jgi:hypothetical protein
MTTGHQRRCDEVRAEEWQSWLLTRHLAALPQYKTLPGT